MSILESKQKEENSLIINKMMKFPSHVTEEQIIAHSKKLADFEEDWKDEVLDVYDQRYKLLFCK